MILSLEDVEDALQQLGIASRFSKQEHERLRSRPSERDNYVAFPTPEDNATLSILGLRNVVGVSPPAAPCFFDHPWYLEEPFGSIPCHPGWHIIRSQPLAKTVGQPVFQAEELKREGLYLPSAVEAVLMLFLCYTVTGERYLLRKHTWTSDRTHHGRFVSIGAFGTKGVFVSSHEVGYASRGLGICPVIAPPATS